MGSGRHEAVAVRDVAGADAVDREAAPPRGLGLRPEGADDAFAAGAPSAKSPGSREAAPQRIDFGQGKLADDGGQDFGQNLRRRAAGALDHGDVELALLRVVFDLRLVERGEPGALQKALDGGVGGADARAAPLLAHVLAAGGQPGDVQRQPPRRREGFRALVEEAALHQGVGDELFQVLRRAALHAGGDFFGEEFEEEIGHLLGATLLPLPLAGRVVARARRGGGVGATAEG